MGIFSWITKEGRSICNVFSSRKQFTVYMHTPKGKCYEESKYGGYGIFGGKDYYELLAELNGKKTRDEGIDMFFKESLDIVYPILSENKNWKGDFSVPNKSCLAQGQYYFDDDEDDIISIFESLKELHKSLVEDIIYRLSNKIMEPKSFDVILNNGAYKILDHKEITENTIDKLSKDLAGRLSKSQSFSVMFDQSTGKIIFDDPDFLLIDERDCTPKGVGKKIYIQKTNDIHFKFKNILNRQYDTTRVLFMVTFAISEYGDYTHSIKFKMPMTEKEAILEVEKYLSKPLTEDYYNLILDGLEDSGIGWEFARKFYKCRGEVLGDNINLVQSYIQYEDHLILNCGVLRKNITKDKTKDKTKE